MTYEEALEFIHSTNKFGSKLGLENIKLLLNRLGNPQKHLKFIHVAGTNGKGSTCAMITEILMASGYRVGLYTSPYIEVFEERMRINGIYISKDTLAQLTFKVKSTIDQMVSEGEPHPTEFEVVTAIGFLYFLQENCDLVVLEVGLGGRLDATNVIDKPLVSVITPIDLDHVAYLGDTIELIAFEKAGIIKDGGYTVAHPQTKGAEEVIKKLSKERHNQLFFAPIEEATWVESTFEHCIFNFREQQYHLGLIAPYQMNNAITAIKTIEVLNEFLGFKIQEINIKEGLKNTRWTGRMEILSHLPVVIIDGAHNMHAILGLCKTLDLWRGSYECVGVVGMLEDKDVKGMTQLINTALDHFVVTEPDIYRALPSERLAEYFDDTKVLKICSKPDEAMEEAIKWANEKPDKRLILVFGSLYLLGDIKRYFKK